MKIEIMSIQNLLHIPSLKNNEECAIVFVTLKPDYYDFGNTDFYLLNIADIDTPIITLESINNIKWILARHEYYKTIYVCCDAGLSRSPAVAYFLATKLGDHKRALEIDDKYRFLNVALFKKLMVEI